MKKIILDLCCCAGGASEGYYRAGFQVYGIDDKPQPNYQFGFLQMDALEAMRKLLDGEGLVFSNGHQLWLENFNAYHASPPCQAYCDNHSKARTYPELIAPIRELLEATGKHFVIENIYKAPLRATLMLCGTMFGLRVIRHRYFEFNWTGPFSPYTCNHQGSVARGDYVAVYSGGYHLPTLPDGTRPFAREKDIQVWADAMGIDWMPCKWELKEAIPPAYTEYIGKYLLQALI